MSKTRKTRKNYLRKITRTGKKVIPVVESGLKTVGRKAKGLAVESVPIIEKGVSKIYGTIAEGFDLGVKGVKGVSKRMSKMSKKSRKKRRHRS